MKIGHVGNKNYAYTREAGYTCIELVFFGEALMSPKYQSAVQINFELQSLLVF